MSHNLYYIPNVRHAPLGPMPLPQSQDLAYPRTMGRNQQMVVSHDLGNVGLKFVNRHLHLKAELLDL